MPPNTPKTTSAANTISAQTLLNADPRAKIAATLALGLLAWQATPAALALYALPTAIACTALGAWNRTSRKTLRAYLGFVLLWMAVKFSLDAAFPPPGMTLHHNLHQSGLLGARLALLIALGLTLSYSTSPRKLGLALAWGLKPLLRQHAWKTALSLALMIHFIPLAHQTAAQARATIKLRNPNRSRRQKMLLLPQTILRVLSQKTWGQTLAVAARNLDTPEAWNHPLPKQPRTWIATGLLIALAWAVRLV